MKTLIIYDDTGNIYVQASWDVVEPHGGLQYIITEIPEGQRIASIDMTTDPYTVIFEDIPKTENQELAERDDLLENALNEKEKLDEYIASMEG